MKKIIFSGAILLTITAFAQSDSDGLPSQNLDNNGIPIQNIFIQKVSPFVQPSILTTFLYDSVRALTEINDSNNADAYPWISPDGLRLYYTSGADSNKLMFTQRTNTNSYFESPTLIPISISSPSSYWLSTNELDVYICTNNYLYVAHRNAVSLPFNTPVSISLIGGPSHSSIKGASLNSTQDVLFICLFDFISVVTEFSRTSSTSFTYVRTLPVPLGYEAKPGQLSKDELTFFFAASFNGSDPLLYQLTRNSPTDTFNISTFEQIQGINDTNLRNNQPSMSDSLNWVVFVRANQALWTANDLFIAHKGSTTSVSKYSEQQISISVFPNPFSTQTILRTDNLFKNATLTVYNFLGQTVKEIKNISGLTVTLFRDNLPSGLYFIRLTQDNKIITIDKLVITD